MIITLNRDTKMSDSTYGVLTCNGQDYQTLEPAIRNQKVYGTTAIPPGSYQIKLRTEGGMDALYRVRFADMHKGMLWLQDVPNFEDVYIHVGNYPKDTKGCILIGTDRSESQSMIMDSTAAYKQFYPGVAQAILDGDDMVITILNPGGV